MLRNVTHGLGDSHGSEDDDGSSGLWRPVHSSADTNASGKRTVCICRAQTLRDYMTSWQRSPKAAVSIAGNGFVHVELFSCIWMAFLNTCSSHMKPLAGSGNHLPM